MNREEAYKSLSDELELSAKIQEMNEEIESFF